MCGLTANIIDLEKLTPEQKREFGRWLRQRKAILGQRLEGVGADLKALNKSHRKKRPSADLYVINKRGA